MLSFKSFLKVFTCFLGGGKSRFNYCIWWKLSGKKTFCILIIRFSKNLGVLGHDIILLRTGARGKAVRDTERAFKTFVKDAKLFMKKEQTVRSGIRTHAYIHRLRPERSALDRSAIPTNLSSTTCIAFSQNLRLESPETFHDNYIIA